MCNVERNPPIENYFQDEAYSANVIFKICTNFVMFIHATKQWLQSLFLVALHPGNVRSINDIIINL